MCIIRHDLWYLVLLDSFRILSYGVKFTDRISTEPNEMVLYQLHSMCCIIGGIRMSSSFDLCSPNVDSCWRCVTVYRLVEIDEILSRCSIADRTRRNNLTNHFGKSDEIKRAEEHEIARIWSLLVVGFICWFAHLLQCWKLNLYLKSTWFEVILHICGERDLIIYAVCATGGMHSTCSLTQYYMHDILKVKEIYRKRKIVFYDSEKTFQWPDIIEAIN